MCHATVCKFGGTSLAGPDQIAKVIDIIRADPKRRYVVPSAPGKRHPKDRKITDLLILCHDLRAQEISFEEAFDAIAVRYREIVEGLNLDMDIDTLLEQVRESIVSGGSKDLIVSRGEWLIGQILAVALDFEFVDAKDLVFFDIHGNFNEEDTHAALGDFWRDHPNAVIPGFYGSMPGGEIVTFPRGGSDITGAIIARGFNTDMYENWTDVPGLSMVDPRIIPDAKAIRVISYEELEELGDGGAQVLHQGAIFPARDAGITINIRDTNNPSDPGTLVVSDSSDAERPHKITGIAAKHFTVITVGKRGINPEVGFVWRILGIMKDFRVSVQHFPGSNNTISLAIERSSLSDDKREKILAAIERESSPGFLTVDDDIGVITVVGRNMINTPGMAATLFASLGDTGINIRLISQGTSELTIVVGIDGNHTEGAIHAIYHAFLNGDV
jgi:aspartate kinase